MRQAHAHFGNEPEVPDLKEADEDDQDHEAVDDRVGDVDEEDSDEVVSFLKVQAHLILSLQVYYLNI